MQSNVILIRKKYLQASTQQLFSRRNRAAKELQMIKEKKAVVIIVEGTPHEWEKKEISYDEVVALEVPNHTPDSNVTYSVTYERGHGDKPEGVLAPGASVRVKKGMIFHVSETGQS